MSKTAGIVKPTRIWIAECPKCGEVCDVQEDRDWAWCDDCENDFDVDKDYIKKMEELEERVLKGE